jgi:hypothetical protein
VVRGFHGDEGPQQAPAGECACIVSHGWALSGELLHVRNRAAHDAGRSLLAHCLNLYAGIVERQDMVGLIAMSQEGSGHGGAYDERDERVPREAGAGVGLHRGCQGGVQAQCLLKAPVSLSRGVDDQEQRPSPSAAIFRDRTMHV